MKNNIIDKYCLKCIYSEVISGFPVCSIVEINNIDYHTAILDKDKFRIPHECPNILELTLDIGELNEFK